MNGDVEKIPLNSGIARVGSNRPFQHLSRPHIILRGDAEKGRVLCKVVSIIWLDLESKAVVLKGEIKKPKVREKN